MKLKDKVVLLTGASKGIGKAIAMALAVEGPHLVLCSRNTAQIQAYLPELSPNVGRVLVQACDLMQEDDIQAVVTKTLAEFGTIDVLINNAGVWITDKVEDSKMADFETLMQTNYMATYSFCHKVLPTMIAQKAGDIVNISSILGQFGASYKAGYCASKFAVMGFSEALRAEVKDRNIRVIVVCPGTTDTDLFGSPVDAAKSLGPDDVAAVVHLALTLPRRATLNEITITPTLPY